MTSTIDIFMQAISLLKKSFYYYLFLSEYVLRNRSYIILHTYTSFVFLTYRANRYVVIAVELTDMLLLLLLLL